jgi:hypothetical protein
MSRCERMCNVQAWPCMPVSGSRALATMGSSGGATALLYPFIGTVAPLPCRLGIADEHDRWARMDSERVNITCGPALRFFISNCSRV